MTPEDEIRHLKGQIAHRDGKLAKQKNEIARLTQHVQTLMSDKRQLAMEAKRGRANLRDALNDEPGWRERAIMEAGK